MKIQVVKIDDENESKLLAMKASQSKERVLNGRTIRNERQRNERKILLFRRLDEQDKALQVQVVKESVLQARPPTIPFDPTTAAPNQGLLEEVSYQLLQERLEVERNRQLLWEKEQRNDITSKKSNKQEDLEKCTQLILKARQKRGLLSATRKQIELQQAARNQVIMQVKLEKSYASHQEALHKAVQTREDESKHKFLQEEESKRKLRELSLVAESSKINREMESKRAKARQSQQVQDDQEFEKVGNEATHSLEIKNRLVCKTKNDLLEQKKDKSREQALTLAQQCKDSQQKVDIYKKASLKEKVRLGEAKMKETLRKLNPYAEKISLEVRQDAALAVRRSW